MSLDTTVLALLRHRERYDRLFRSVPIRALEPAVGVILADYGAYFKEFPDAKVIESGPFLFWMRGFRRADMKDDVAAVIGALLKRAEEPIDLGTEAGMLKRLAAAAAAMDLVALVERFNAGEDVDLRTETEHLMDTYDQQVVRQVKNPQVLDDINELLKAEANDTGLHWRLPCLNRHIKPLVGGDFIIVAGRPDKGKTTFLSSELTYMAAQIDAIYPWETEDERRSILWFNNEGPGKRIVVRNFQAAIGEHGSTMEDLVKYSADGSIKAKYAEALGGRGGTLRVMDIHGMWNHEVEELIRRFKPAVVVFDMIDNIQFGGGAANNGQRTDQLLEAMYQWARMIGVKYDCVVIATSQISADGDGQQYPTLPMLKDSKTGKQGAADVIVTIGTVNDPMLENSRYIGTTKNKKVRTGRSASPKQEVQFCGDRARYVEHEA
jgi:replicative DNA helicase